MIRFWHASHLPFWNHSSPLAVRVGGWNDFSTKNNHQKQRPTWWYYIFLYYTIDLLFQEREQIAHHAYVFQATSLICFSQKSVGKELGESFLKHNILCPNLQHGVKKGTDGDWFLHSPHSIVVSDIYSNEGI